MAHIRACFRDAGVDFERVRAVDAR